MSFASLPAALQEEVAIHANLDIPHIITTGELRTYTEREFTRWIPIYEAPSPARWRLVVLHSQLQTVRGMNSPYGAGDASYIVNTERSRLYAQIFHEEVQKKLEILTYADEWDYPTLDVTQYCRPEGRHVCYLYGEKLELWLNYKW